MSCSTLSIAAVRSSSDVGRMPELQHEELVSAP
jgi:hypothetical protein